MTQQVPKFTAWIVDLGKSEKNKPLYAGCGVGSAAYRPNYWSVKFYALRRAEQERRSGMYPDAKAVECVVSPVTAALFEKG
jgi:hypothetical protein